MRIEDSYQYLRQHYGFRVRRRMLLRQKRLYREARRSSSAFRPKDLLSLVPIGATLLFAVSLASNLLGAKLNLWLAPALVALPIAFGHYVFKRLNRKVAARALFDALGSKPRVGVSEEDTEAILQTLLGEREQETARALIRDNYQSTLKDLIVVAKALT